MRLEEFLLDLLATVIAEPCFTLTVRDMFSVAIIQLGYLQFTVGALEWLQWAIFKMLLHDLSVALKVLTVFASGL